MPRVTSKPRREADVKAAVAKYLKARGVRWFRMNSGSIPMAYNGKERRINLAPPGTPDFLVLCPRGSVSFKPEGASQYTTISRSTGVLWLEIKRPLGVRGGTGGSEQNDDQVRFQQEAEQAGERYVVVRSVEDVEKALTP